MVSFSAFYAGGRGFDSRIRQSYCLGTSGFVASEGNVERSRAAQPGNAPRAATEWLFVAALRRRAQLAKPVYLCARAAQNSDGRLASRQGARSASHRVMRA